MPWSQCSTWVQLFLWPTLLPPLLPQCSWSGWYRCPTYGWTSNLPFAPVTTRKKCSVGPLCRWGNEDQRGNMTNRGYSWSDPGRSGNSDVMLSLRGTKWLQIFSCKDKNGVMCKAGWEIDTVEQPEPCYLLTCGVFPIPAAAFLWTIQRLLFQPRSCSISLQCYVLSSHCSWLKQL